MSETVTLQGAYFSPAERAANLIRFERAQSPELSRLEHDILQGIEENLIAGEEAEILGFVGTTALAVGALAKSGALKKVAGFVGKLKDKIKGKIRDRRAKRGGKSDPEENAVLQTLENVQAKAQAGSGLYHAKAQAENSQIDQPQMQVAPAPALPAVYAPAVQSATAPGAGFNLDKNTLLLLGLAGLFLLQKRR